MYYLPLAGSLQPPAVTAPQVALRVMHQSAVDWLFGAITRAALPVGHLVELPLAEVLGGTGAAAQGARVRLFRPDPVATLQRLREHWIDGQVAYHRKNALIMGRLEAITEDWGQWLARAVVVAVAADLGIVIADLTHLLPGWLAWAHAASPWLMFLAAVLPAAVASLNGLRFQSECRSLAERSRRLAAILAGRPARGNAPAMPGRRDQADALAASIRAARQQGADVGGWTLDALRVTELVARDCAHEVAEWSVLSAKELPET